MAGHARQLHGFTIIDALQFTQCQIISEPPQTKKNSYTCGQNKT